MSKLSRHIKEPLVIPVVKPRNPFGVGTNMAKAGRHQKSNKSLRQEASKQDKNAYASFEMSS